MEDFSTLDLKKIGERIRNARQKCGMSQATLAEKAGLSVPAVSDIENGKTNMLLMTFARIIVALQGSADEILRVDAPVSKEVYRKEFTDILSDCTPAEADAILKIVKELKQTMRTNKEDY